MRRYLTAASLIVAFGFALLLGLPGHAADVGGSNHCVNGTMCNFYSALVKNWLWSGTGSNTDMVGTLTVPTDAGFSTYTFVGPYTVQPNCVFSNQTHPGRLVNYAISATTLSVDAGQAFAGVAGAWAVGSDVIGYVCAGQN